jgi:hypothetical protein
MKPTRTALLPILIIAALALGACTLLEPLPTRDAAPKPPPLEPRVIAATGQWKPTAQQIGTLPAAQLRLLAAQEARRAAVHRLTEQLHDFPLADGTTVSARTRGNAAARDYVAGLVRNANVITNVALPDRSHQVRIETTLPPAGQACLMQGNCPLPPGCDGRPLRKVLVTAFPLHYPEQIRHGEYMGWPQATAEELTHQLNRSGKVLGAAAAHRFPFTAAESAPAAAHQDGVPLLTQWAAQAQAHYVVAGLFRDFGVAKKHGLIPERQMIVEAYVYDGISGELLAQREFAQQVILGGSIPKILTPGTRDFSTSRLGQAYYALLGEIGAWAENTVGCLPFSARVIRVEGTQLHLDVGSENGLAAGMELVLTRATEARTSAAGALLAGERLPLAGAVIKSVQPRHSVAELSLQRNAPTVRVGDVLYAP